jgi:hypothetical protein
MAESLAKGEDYALRLLSHQHFSLSHQQVTLSLSKGDFLRAPSCFDPSASSGQA